MGTKTCPTAADAEVGPIGVYDYKMMAGGGSPYAIDNTGDEVASHATDALDVYTTIRVLLEAMGGGTIRQSGGTFNWSGPAYLQGEPGGAVPDYPHFCRLIGNGSARVNEANATHNHFPADTDGFIVDMHTNNGNWYTGSQLKQMAIHGTLTSEMDSAIVLWKTSDMILEDIRVFYMGSGGHGVEFINCQHFHVTDFRTDSHIPNMSSIYVSNIDAVAEGYTEQGAHQLYTRVEASVGSGGAASAGCRGWEFEIPSGTANLGNINFVSCDTFGAGAYNTAVRYGYYIHNVAAGFDAWGWSSGCNFEGLDQTNGERNIYIDTDAGYFRGDIYNGGFPGATTGVQLDHDTTRLGFHSCVNQPDLLIGNGQFFWDRTPTPGTITAGTNVYAIAGSNVCNWGQATITGAVNLVTVNHGMAMSTVGWLPRFCFTPLQDIGVNRTWIDTITTTQFNINFAAQPGGATWLFDWWGSLDQGL